MQSRRSRTYWLTLLTFLHSAVELMLGKTISREAELLVCYTSTLTHTRSRCLIPCFRLSHSPIRALTFLHTYILVHIPPPPAFYIWSLFLNFHVLCLAFPSVYSHLPPQPSLSPPLPPLPPFSFLFFIPPPWILFQKMQTILLSGFPISIIFTPFVNSGRNRCKRCWSSQKNTWRAEVSDEIPLLHLPILSFWLASISPNSLSDWFASERKQKKGRSQKCWIIPSQLKLRQRIQIKTCG